MQRKVSFLLPMNIFEALQVEAAKYQISISDLIRERISMPEATDLRTHFSHSANSTSQTGVQTYEDNPLHLEVLFLLREFLFERNAQILKRVDEKLERRFGKDRKKIL